MYTVTVLWGSNYEALLNTMVHCISTSIDVCLYYLDLFVERSLYLIEAMLVCMDKITVAYPISTYRPCQSHNVNSNLLCSIPLVLHQIVITFFLFLFLVPSLGAFCPGFLPTRIFLPLQIPTPST